MPCIFTRGSSSRSISFNRSPLMSVRNILSFSACSSQSSASSSPSCVKMEKAYHQWQWFPICIHFDAVQFGAANLKKTKNTSSVTSRTLSFYSFLFKLLSVPNHNCSSFSFPKASLMIHPCNDDKELNMKEITKTASQQNLMNHKGDGNIISYYDI